MNVEATQEDRDLAGWFVRRMDGGELYRSAVEGLLARHRQAAYEKGKADYEASMTRVQREGRVR